MSTGTVTQADEIIVIVSGQEYRVPKATSLEDVRAHLAGMFPDVATATIQKGKTTREVDGVLVEFETAEFVKRAGTKGIGGVELLAALTQAPAISIGVLPPGASALLVKLRARQLTIAEALDADLMGILDALPSARTTRGADLCLLIDALPAVPGSDLSGW